MQWDPDLLDKFVAPGISKFTDARIPDLSLEFPEARYWLANHFLNNTLSGSFPDRTRQLVMGYLRRAHHAFEAYHDAPRSAIGIRQDS